MKKMMIYSAIGYLSILVSCKEDPDLIPHEWSHFFAFVDDSGNDFFLDNPDYSSVKLYYPIDEKLLAFDDSVNIDNIAIFGYWAWGRSPQYFSFENGDIDTLTVSWTPASINRLKTYFDKVESMSFFYNGKFVEKWDFIQDPDLKYNLKNINHTYKRHLDTRSPIYIKLPKRQNPDEFY